MKEVTIAKVHARNPSTSLFEEVTWGGINVITEGGTDTSDANAAPGDLLSGKTAYVNGIKITGNIPLKAAQTFIPSTIDQEVVSGQYLAGNQTIKGDANLLSSNIKSGITIFGVTGNSNVVDTTEPGSTTASSSNVQTGMSAYVNGVRITGIADPIVASGSNITYTPTVTDQVIQGPKILQGNKTLTIAGDVDLVAGNIKKDVVIFGVTGTYEGDGGGIDTSDATATASDMKAGVTAYVDGAKITGDAYTRTSQVNSVADGLIDGTAHWLKPGFYSGISYEAMPTLIASNIKKGVTIYGVTGTYGPIEEFVFDTTSATSAADVYSDWGSDILVYVEGDQLRTLSNIQSYSEQLVQDAGHWSTPHWVSKCNSFSNYGILGSNGTNEDGAISAEVWDFQNKDLQFITANPVHIDGTTVTFEFIVEMYAFSSSGACLIAFIQAQDLTQLKTRLDNHTYAAYQNITLTPALSGVQQEYSFDNFTPGDYYMVVGIHTGSMSGFQLEKLGYFAI